MSESRERIGGGCLCGALRYEAQGAPLYAGYCCCSDCRKASGSGFIPFMGFARDAVSFSGACKQFRSKAARGGEAVRNSCPMCNSLVFGGEIDKSEIFNLYAGSLDDPSFFQPKMAIFARGRPDWAIMPHGLPLHDALPPQSGEM